MIRISTLLISGNSISPSLKKKKFKKKGVLVGTVEIKGDGDLEVKTDYEEESSQGIVGFTVFNGDEFVRIEIM